MMLFERARCPPNDKPEVADAPCCGVRSVVTAGVMIEKLMKLRPLIGSSSICSWLMTVEIEVRGNELVRHSIDGKPVLEYAQPQLDPNDADAQRLLAAGSPLLLDHGTISLQSESHPIEFRKVELLELTPGSAR